MASSGRSGQGKPKKATPGERAKAASDAHKTIARNKKAGHDYFIEDRYEAGLALTGTEVKALRMGRASLTEAWIEIDRNGEAWLQGAHIPEYLQGTWNNHAPRRKRKLLLHRAELAKLAVRVAAKGFTIVPLELYFIGGRAKIEIALARGKQDWDKRQALREAQDNREAQRAMAAANRRRG
ncbi:SsrA-binding protein SmpB [Actinomyces timonensis]|uniref:SsrA-binding protein n=1 Tax=Actinomyces timonensis TaxID=1288391 RepID=A0AAU8N237_9ACTO